MKFYSCLVPFALLLGATVCSAQNINLDYSNITNELIQFTGTGDTINFKSNASDRGFAVTNSSQPGLAGLLGTIDGVFTIGAITPMGSFEEAPVTGTGVFKLYENNSNTSPVLTANVNWGDVLRVGPAGILNPNALLNLSNFQYAGTAAPLNALANSMAGTTVVTFQFLPPVTLTQLKTDGAVYTASYSGTANTDALISPIPEPSSYAVMMGGAMILGVTLIRRRRLAA